MSMSVEKAQALQDLQSGEAPIDVRERYGIKRKTLNTWIHRWRRSGHLPTTPPGNVVSLPQTGKTKAEKLREAHRMQSEQRLSARARSIPPVDRLVLRRIARKIIHKLDSGLMCSTCDGDEAQPLTASDFHLYTRSYVQHLDALSRSLEVETTLGGVSDDGDALDLDSPETIAALGRSLIRLGPRRLAAVMESDSEAAAVVQAALNELERVAM